MSDVMNDAMADLASDAVDLYGGILFTTLMVMLVGFGLVGQAPVFRRTYPVIPLRPQVQAINPFRM
jgi:hypothetical protein